jgi:hypothetical protein
VKYKWGRIKEKCTSEFTCDGDVLCGVFRIARDVEKDLSPCSNPLFISWHSSVEGKVELAGAVVVIPGAIANIFGNKIRAILATRVKSVSVCQGKEG